MRQSHEAKLYCSAMSLLRRQWCLGSCRHAQAHLPELACLAAWSSYRPRLSLLQVQAVLTHADCAYGLKAINRDCVTPSPFTAFVRHLQCAQPRAGQLQ